VPSVVVSSVVVPLCRPQKWGQSEEEGCSGDA